MKSNYNVSIKYHGITNVSVASYGALISITKLVVLSPTHHLNSILMSSNKNFGANSAPGIKLS